MTISVKMNRDSVSPAGIRLSTMEWRYPRFVHAEVMTHRVFSRNASSSRAIPTAKLIQDVLDDPAIPLKWSRNKPGMQPGEDEIEDTHLAYLAWIQGRDAAIRQAEYFAALGLSKQYVNRVLEPYAHIKVVVTATNYVNFYHLRRSTMAQLEMQVLADMAYDAQVKSKPELLTPGEWHLPYVTFSDFGAAEQFLQMGQISRSMPSKHEVIQVLKKVSVARCARTSYLLHDGTEAPIAKDVDLYERLVGSSPLHASPAEHQATPDVWGSVDWGAFDWRHPKEHGNFEGWIQLRKTLKGECINEDAYPMSEMAFGD